MMKLSTLLLVLCTACLSGCSWINDNYDHCPSGTWIQLTYTYNMLDAEAVTTQVFDASVFVIDDNGQCVGQQNVDSFSLQSNQYRIRLPELPEGTYDILVWSGGNDPHFRRQEDGMELGEETQREALGNLFYGRTSSVMVNESYQIIPVSLMKDTKRIATTLQLLSGEKELDMADFQLEIEANNRKLDAYNLPSGHISYYPFLHETARLDSLSVVQSGFHTLRLLTGDGTRMRLKHLPTGSQVFDIPLTDYLVLAGMTDFLHMGEQEYLDREDHFQLLFFLNETQLPERPYTCTMLQIRSWIIRLNETELGSHL